MNTTPNSPTETQPPANQAKEHSRVGTAWVSLLVFVLLLFLLAIFILQNSTKVQISFFGFHGNLSFGVGMLFAAIAGSVLTLLIGSIRILQLKARRRKATI
jgi:uncharacterized integral membrane protein